MYSWDFIEENPTITVAWAMNILGNHGYDSDTVREYANCLWFDNDEQIVEIDHNEEVSSQQLVDWLGY